MYFKRKVYQKLIDWKKQYSDKYAVILEGARRVGKTTIAENFAKNEYRSYILIDFSKAADNIQKCFDDIANLSCRRAIQLSGNWFTDFYQEKREGYSDSFRRDENTGMAYGL